MFAIIDAPVAGAYQLVLALSGVVPPAMTIALFTIAVRLLLHPLARAAARGEQVRAELAPKIRELQRRYGKDRAKFQQELQRISGGSMFAGCLPMLIQIPFFIVMFRLFSTTTVSGEYNVLMDSTVFGTPLGLHGVAGLTDPVFLVLFAALAIVAWCSVRIMKRGATTDLPGVVRLLPYGSVLGAAVIPLAAGIYLLTTTAWGTAERAYLRR